MPRLGDLPSTSTSQPGYKLATPHRSTPCAFTKGAVATNEKTRIHPSLKSLMWLPKIYSSIILITCFEIGNVIFNIFPCKTRSNNCLHLPHLLCQLLQILYRQQNIWFLNHLWIKCNYWVLRPLVSHCVFPKNRDIYGITVHNYWFIMVHTIIKFKLCAFGMEGKPCSSQCNTSKDTCRFVPKLRYWPQSKTQHWGEEYIWWTHK